MSIEQLPASHSPTPTLVCRDISSPLTRYDPPAEIQTHFFFWHLVIKGIEHSLGCII